MMRTAEKFVVWSEVAESAVLLKPKEREQEMTVNEKKVLANVEGMAQWLTNYQQETFGVSGDLTGKNQDLTRYFSEFHGEFNDFERDSDEKELLSEIKKSPLIFLGDFHNLSQSQKFTAELIEKIASQDRLIKALAVEFIFSDGQKFLDQYQAGKISEAVFLKKIRESLKHQTFYT